MLVDIIKSMTLTEFEIEVLGKMLKQEFSDSEIKSIISTSLITGYDYTGAGYFLKLTNKLIPINRKVISKPTLIGETEDIQLGFVLFLENNTLTIECHGWGDKNPPENIRMKIIEIKEI